MPKVRVLVFASLTDHLGSAARQVEAAEGATVKALRDTLCGIAPAASATLKSCRVAVNRSFAESEDQTLSEGDEVAFIPPVSGG